MANNDFYSAADLLKSKMKAFDDRIKAHDDSQPYAALDNFTVIKIGEPLPEGVKLVYAFEPRLITAIVGNTGRSPVSVLMERVLQLGGNALLNVRTELGHVVGVPALLAQRAPSPCTLKELRETFKAQERLVIDELQPLIDETNRRASAHNDELREAWRSGYRAGSRRL